MEYKKITKEMLEEAKNCKSDEERKAFIEKNNIQLPDEILNNISGGNDEEGYRCSECGKVLDGWLSYQVHLFEHLPN